MSIGMHQESKKTDYETSSQKESASCSRKLVCSTISVGWEPPQIHRLQASRRKWKIQEKKLIRSGDWIQIESPNGAASIPDSQLGPHPHSSSLFSKLCRLTHFLLILYPLCEFSNPKITSNLIAQKYLETPRDFFIREHIFSLIFFRAHTETFVPP